MQPVWVVTKQAHFAWQFSTISVKCSQLRYTCLQERFSVPRKPNASEGTGRKNLHPALVDTSRPEQRARRAEGVLLSHHSRRKVTEGLGGRSCLRRQACLACEAHPCAEDGGCEISATCSNTTLLYPWLSSQLNCETNKRHLSGGSD